MRRKVSGATPTLKEVLSKVVTVRHVPAQTRVLVWALAAVFCMCVCVCVCVCNIYSLRLQVSSGVM